MIQKVIRKPLKNTISKTLKLSTLSTPEIKNVNNEINEKNNAINKALNSSKPRNDWTVKEIKEIYNSPLLELVYNAQTIHKKFQEKNLVQLCTLLSIKTGGCTEDCSYCAQSTRYKTGVKASKLIELGQVLSAAREAKKNGSTRFCMGAAWRDMVGRKSGLKHIKEMITEVRKMDLEVCVTLGMVSDAVAKELKDSGLTAYNHNVDTSREFYPKVITTRSYDDRLKTIDNVRNEGISVCSGGILGLGETSDDHIGLLYTLSTMPSHPESVPINALVPIEGTPLGDQIKNNNSENKQIDFKLLLRTIATARCIMPASIVRLAAGRISLSEEQQAFAFMAGANAIFTGEKMLTTPTTPWETDIKLLNDWGLKPMKSFHNPSKPANPQVSTNEHIPTNDQISTNKPEIPII